MQIQSQMAGVVLRISVAVGDKVSMGQEVATLESMKMEIPIEAEGEGTVQEIRVQSGDFVQEGDVLVVLG